MAQGRRPVALVTGGRQGIGLAIAEALAKAGHDVAITGIEDGGPNDPVVETLRSLGVDASYLKADLADVDGHAATIEDVLQTFGAIDCLVNNAGIGSIVRGDFIELKPENFDAVLDTNLRGTVFFTQAVVKAMLESGAGQATRSIVNITSVSSELTSPERLDYCISKAGLSAFTKGLAVRLAESGIGVFEVRPGIIRTAMTATVAEKYDALISGGLVPMKRWGEAEDIGAIVAALASGSFGFATGSVIDAGGGLSIGRL
ncbi:3-ketoacyl-ACP reductase [Rhizobium mongolense]|uniref:NAD(P)-dependent dehydrogenase (Short-subunit alcohol dehydrogenase family) n=1 Tax=Rhizobium mongolense TaxID=57676 RepID=A0A7W6RHV7_9HYPH|nr:3-ketoacyl-ACP reductase [Rhizobium mongolense]MBB4272582.1 NAD(P)-dependent dehydrogenase (short-subunit alcohol dehydrogenase family) [Rhizobium mongolense]